MGGLHRFTLFFITIYFNNFIEWRILLMGAIKQMSFSSLPVKIGDHFYIHDNLPFEDRELKVDVMEDGIHLSETIDGVSESIYVSYAELAALMYQLSHRKLS